MLHSTRSLRLMVQALLQPRVASAESMRYDEMLRNSGIRAEKTIMHPGEVLLLPYTACNSAELQRFIRIYDTEPARFIFKCLKHVYRHRHEYGQLSSQSYRA